MAAVGKVYLIGAGPGDPGLLTLKGKACLEAADVVLYDRLVSPEILAFARPDAVKVYVGKSPDGHAAAQAEIHRRLIEEASAGRTVARLKGGDPFVFGRGAEEAQALAAHGIPFEVIPGVTSAIAVPAYAGIPVTHRSIASGFHVVTGHECGESPGTPWELLASSRQTLIILMGVGGLPRIAETLLRHGRPPETPVAVVAQGTTAQQQVVMGTLATIADEVAVRGVRPPATVIVGDVVRLAEEISWYRPVSAEPAR